MPALTDQFSIVLIARLSSARSLAKNAMSSANAKTLLLACESWVIRSSMYKLKSVGDVIAPYGTPRCVVTR